MLSDCVQTYSERTPFGNAQILAHWSMSDNAVVVEQNSTELILYFDETPGSVSCCSLYRELN